MGQTISSIVSDVRVLANLAMAPFRHAGESHKERLEAFYQAQAGDYDAFRKRLLQGREELMAEAKAAHGEGGIWVDLGGGTGANLEMMGDEAIMSFAKVYLVDLCGPLLEVARKRCEERGWHNVQIVEDDATTWVPEEGYGQVNLITFSYSLTMIPDWYAAIEHAAALLAPGGLIGTVDFYVARKHPAEGMAKHSWLQRTFWPTWFLMDDVRLNMDHVPYLLRKFQKVAVVEGLAQVPYIGWLLPKVPYYRFIGKLELPEHEEEEDDAAVIKLPPAAASGKKVKAAGGKKLDIEVPTFQKPRMVRQGSSVN
ncbi:methyltransferase type 11 domain protein [Chrysochromulina tobinii]|uniref:Methyltransferase type 11 domain protein n=1 Tax=Chrysochromulina tobinii TaxID=1460289 RepID=A0A0M0J8H7_9EUKA|nr:methyltransferase type 11 domain protein [Chrysochromulina tobinii]|eukprot:KOO22652.1 methyltransferase type 11 domain protein [Chrysochromulina sp. CCMP291]